jgi:NADH dehydrogenase [ubiquinone] 1 alpha subcomplex assembly factor 5
LLIEVVVPVERVHADLEISQPFPDNSVDAVVSSMSLHWVNDLLGAMKKINAILKPDGVFVAAMVGGDSLFELRYTSPICFNGGENVDAIGGIGA